MADSIYDNTAAAAATPATGPTIDTEVKDTRSYAEKYAEQQQAERDAAVAKLPPDEQRRIALTRELVSNKLTDAERAEKTRELRALVASQATPEEQAAQADATPQQRRAEYGVEDPRLPKPWLEDYNQRFINWESPLYDLAHEHGLAAEQVRGLRDAAVDLGQAVSDTGRPASEADLKYIFDKHKVSPSARTALTRLWRQIEGAS